MGKRYNGQKLVDLSYSEVQELMEKEVDNMDHETRVDFLRNRGYE